MVANEALGAITSLVRVKYWIEIGIPASSGRPVHRLARLLLTPVSEVLVPAYVIDLLSAGSIEASSEQRKDEF
jgi:hypothetical protein